MSIPDYQTLMLPLLRLAADGSEHRFRDAVEQLAAEFQLSDQERATMLPSGTAPMFDNRVGWAKTYLKQAGLIDTTRRGYFRITLRGTELLGTNPDLIDASTLENYEEFRAFRSRRSEEKGGLHPRLWPLSLLHRQYPRPHQRSCSRKPISGCAAIWKQKYWSR